MMIAEHGCLSKHIQGLGYKADLPAATLLALVRCLALVYLHSLWALMN